MLKSSVSVFSDWRAQGENSCFLLSWMSFSLDRSLALHDECNLFACCTFVLKEKNGGKPLFPAMKQNVNCKKEDVEHTIPAFGWAAVGCRCGWFTDTISPMQCSPRLNWGKTLTQKLSLFPHFVPQIHWSLLEEVWKRVGLSIKSKTPQTTSVSLLAHTYQLSQFNVEAF